MVRINPPFGCTDHWNVTTVCNYFSGNLSLPAARVIAHASDPCKLFFAGDHKLRRPQKRALYLRVWEGANCLAGRLGVLGGAIMRSVERIVVGKNAEDVRVRDSIEGALLDYGSDLSFFFRRTAFQCVNDRHGYLAFAQVASNRLAQYAL